MRGEKEGMETRVLYKGKGREQTEQRAEGSGVYERDEEAWNIRENWTRSKRRSERGNIG